MKKWEYKILNIKSKGAFSRGIKTDDLNQKFTELGDEGWEFVESQRLDSSGWTDTVLFIFRKEKQ